ncbi:MAG: hypothetical protein C0592_11935 [Marinilabiliales bacterium]|nr:MAG: hypothetical protein C0592_11935 [Marinilabiliales bacterium]
MKKYIIYPVLILALFSVTLAACSGSGSSENSTTRNNDSVKEDQVENILTENDLKDKDANELLIMRNEIFARHGYKFKNNFLAHYFAQFDWYKPQYDNIDDKLSEADKSNLELVIEAENKLIGKDLTFESLVAKFRDISNKSLYLNESYNDGVDKGSFLNNLYLNKYFDIETSSMQEDCFFLKLQPVAMYYIEDANQLALITYNVTCPVPAVWLEYVLYVFDFDGKLLAKYDLAHDRGGVGDFTHAEAELNKGKIIKHVRKEWWDEERSQVEPYEIEENFSMHVIYNPETQKFTEEKPFEYTSSEDQ